MTDRLFEAGALDVFCTAVADEEGPAGHAPDRACAGRAARGRSRTILFRETTTIGVRFERWRARCSSAHWVDGDAVRAARCGSRWPAGDGDGAQRRPGVRRLPPRGARCRSSPSRPSRPRRCGPGTRPPREAGTDTIESEVCGSCRRDPMPRFYLTTAIDYVNNRPHLGTRVREDRRRRHRPLQAARRIRRPLRHGQRRALAERLPKAREAGPGPAGLLRPDGAGVPRRSGTG